MHRKAVFRAHSPRNIIFTNFSCAYNVAVARGESFFIGVHRSMANDYQHGSIIIARRKIEVFVGVAESHLSEHHTACIEWSWCHIDTQYRVWFRSARVDYQSGHGHSGGWARARPIVVVVILRTENIHWLTFYQSADYVRFSGQLRCPVSGQKWLCPALLLFQQSNSISWVHPHVHGTTGDHHRTGRRQWNRHRSNANETTIWGWAMGVSWDHWNVDPAQYHRVLPTKTCLCQWHAFAWCGVTAPESEHNKICRYGWFFFSCSKECTYEFLFTIL